MLFKRLLVLAMAVAAASVASAQVLPGVPGVGGTVGGVLNDPLGEVEQTTRDVTRMTTRELRNAREIAARQLLRRYPNQIDTDPDGAIVIRSEVVATQLSRRRRQEASVSSSALSPEASASTWWCCVLHPMCRHGARSKRCARSIRQALTISTTSISAQAMPRRLRNKPTIAETLQRAGASG
jgi:hypothetical protein